MDRIQALRRLTLIILAIGWLPTAQSADPAAWATVKLKLAQTHVIETLPGRVWNTDKIDMELHLVGLRKTLAIVEYNEAAIPTVPRLKVSHAELAEPVIVTLNPPALFPPTLGDLNATSLDDGAPYSVTAYSVVLDAALIAQGLEIVIMMDGGGGEVLYNLTGHVGAPTKLTFYNLPFYWYGASESLTQKGILSAERVGNMPTERQVEYFGLSAVANFTSVLHSARKFEHRDFVSKPRGCNSGKAPCVFAATRLSSREQMVALDPDEAAYNKFSIIGHSLILTRLIRQLDGERDLASLVSWRRQIGGIDSVSTYRLPTVCCGCYPSPSPDCYYYDNLLPTYQAAAFHCAPLLAT